MAEFRAALQKAAEKIVTETGTSTASKEPRLEERRIPEKDPLMFRIPPVDLSRNLEQGRRQINGRQGSRHIDSTGAKEGKPAKSNCFGRDLVCHQTDLNDSCVPSTIFFDQAEYDDSTEEYIFVDSSCPVAEEKDMYPTRGLMDRFSLKYAVVSGVGWVLDRMEFGRASRILEFEMTATMQTQPNEVMNEQRANHLVIEEETEQVE
jgi:hypothetical protein